MTETIFSQIIRREIPADIVYEDDLCLGFRDTNPQAPIHILIIPKDPITGLSTVKGENNNLLGHLLLMAKKIATNEGIGTSGYRIVINSGPDGGQTVEHLHIHLIGGTRLGWPP
ncbi:MAG: histidine triad nucleotide-binding protein [Candidatus Latescibacterota bacterium]|nr:histidine triad nucleotide-binding protein [Candidatus Latescibacterota bacterium]